MTHSINREDGRLSIPEDIAIDPDAIELIDVWLSKSQVVIMSRTGTKFDSDPALWGTIIAAVVRNIAEMRKEVVGVDVAITLETIKRAISEKL